MKSIYTGICLSWLLWACNGTWNDHYTTVQDGMLSSDKGVWEYLQGEATYSELVALIQATQADTFFNGNRQYTLWAAPNGQYGWVNSLSDSVKILAARNQFTQGKYLETGFQEDLVLRAVSGKMFRMRVAGSGYVLAGVPIVKSVMNCKDGIIYEIQEPLRVQETLYDYLSRTPKYEWLVTFLHDELDTIFDRDRSTLTGDVDYEGNPLYDSVWMIQPKLLSSVPLHKDNNYYTIFVAPSAEYATKVENFYNDVRLITGFTPMKADTTKLTTWIRNSFVHRGLIERYGEKEVLSSIFGVTWNTTYQKVLPGSRLEFSNGYLYELEELFIPNKLLQNPDGTANNIIQAYDADPSAITVDVTGEIGIGDLNTSMTRERIGITSTYYLLSKMELASGATDTPPLFDYAVSWETALKNESTDEYQPVYMTPGEYTVEFIYIKTIDASQNFAVYINDMLIGEVDVSKSLMNTRLSARLGRVNIPQETGIAQVKITVKSLNKGWKRALAPIGVYLVPTVNNY
ncbi:MAG: hypothetical protein LBK12_09225 [Odoribacteraceae bacterium]|nr:hypothetical protein [Odoribacteraceae bacterium]